MVQLRFLDGISQRQFPGAGALNTPAPWECLATRPSRRQLAVSLRRQFFALGAVLLAIVLVSHSLEQSARSAEATADSPNDVASTADHLFFTGHYAEAIEQYQQLQTEAPILAAVGLSKCYQEQGKREEARQVVVDGLQQHTESTELLARLAALDFDAGQHPEAQRRVSAILAQNENHVAARWLKAELARSAGRLEQAANGYQWLVDYYNAADRIESPDDLRWIGRAAARYAGWNRLDDQLSFLVNDLFPSAKEKHADYWPAHYEAGVLFLEKFNQAEAARELAAARRINPHAPDVLAALAELAIQNFEIDKARALLARALQVNPNHVSSLLLQADSHLAMFDLKAAEAMLIRARRLNRVHEPTLGRLAAVQGMLDDSLKEPQGSRLGQLITQVTAQNPHCGPFYLHLANALEKSRKYPDAANYYAQAVKAMPQLVGPRGQLGLMHMRLGDEQAARRVLEESFEIDPFNVRVKNSLEVLDVLDNYTTIETDHFVFRYDPAYDAVLAEFAAEYLEAVLPELTERLQYELPDKTLIELFNRAKNTDGHGWFSARIVGLPRIHTIGACAGKMVALTSPTSMRAKRFNWARVLRHELVHVINLQQTDFNIPHWFTEGLAVLLEDQPRQAEWNTLLVQRGSVGELFNLDTINLGFVRPASGDDWQLAYCQSELYCEYMLKQFGQDALIKMLNAYRDNLRTGQAIEHCFGVSVAEFERGHAQFVSKLLAELQAGGVNPPSVSMRELRKRHQEDPQDLELAAELAVRYLRRKQYEQAGELASQVLTRDAEHPRATYVKAKLLLVIGERKQAKEWLEKVADSQPPVPEVLQTLASLYLNEQNYAAAQELLARGAQRQPHNPSWTKSLALVAFRQGDNQRLATLLEHLADGDGDNLLWRKKLALIAQSRGDHHAAARWAAESLQIEVTDAAMHALRAKSLAATERHAQAVGAYELALQLSPRRRDLWLGLARSNHQTGRTEQARAALRKVLSDNPQDVEAAALLKEWTP